ncbi:MAG TPA: hypothetical protein EYP88_05650 [Anaerolineales bacterium]|nr:hypothetical protein [Anaerolineales bacterium]
MPSREDIRARRRKKKQQQRLTMILISAGVALIAFAIIMLPSIQRALTPLQEFTIPAPNPRPMADGNAMGDPEAPVTIIEFTSFGCGHCGDFAQGTGERLTEEYVSNGQVYFVARGVGSLIGNSLTQRAEEAAYCAADQNKYWEYHDIIFANQSLLFFSGLTHIDNYLNAFAEALGLDTDTFSECLDNHVHQDQVKKDERDARAAGVSGTPSFLINGILLEGNQPYRDFQAMIEEALP